MNKKKLIWILPILMMGFVVGAWLFTINGGFSATVESLPGYATLNLDIKSLSVNVTNGSDSDSVDTKFLLNKDTILLVKITEIYQDNSGGDCIDGQNDCIMEYYLQNDGSMVRIYNGQNISIKASPSLRSLNATIRCQAYSCPQSRSANIVLTEVSN